MSFGKVVIGANGFSLRILEPNYTDRKNMHSLRARALKRVPDQPAPRRFALNIKPYFP